MARDIIGKPYLARDLFPRGTRVMVNHANQWSEDGRIDNWEIGTYLGSNLWYGFVEIDSIKSVRCVNEWMIRLVEEDLFGVPVGVA